MNNDPQRVSLQDRLSHRQLLHRRLQLLGPQRKARVETRTASEVAQPRYALRILQLSAGDGSEPEDLRDVVQYAKSELILSFQNSP